MEFLQAFDSLQSNWHSTTYNNNESADGFFFHFLGHQIHNRGTQNAAFIYLIPIYLFLFIYLSFEQNGLVPVEYQVMTHCDQKERLLIRQSDRDPQQYL